MHAQRLGRAWVGARLAPQREGPPSSGLPLIQDALPPAVHTHDVTGVIHIEAPANT